MKVDKSPAELQEKIDQRCSLRWVDFAWDRFARRALAMRIFNQESEKCWGWREKDIWGWREKDSWGWRQEDIFESRYDEGSSNQEARIHGQVVLRRP